MQARHRHGGSPRIIPCLTMREQIIIQISLRDDVPLRWRFSRDYNARSSLPSKQRVAGSNPAGRAQRSSRFSRVPVHVWTRTGRRDCRRPGAGQMHPGVSAETYLANA